MDRWYLNGWVPLSERTKQVESMRSALGAALRTDALAAAAIDGWFPHINASGVIASGSVGIWLTDFAGSRQVSPVGTGPVWAGSTLVFNRDDGTTDVGGQGVSSAYNDYSGSEDERWAGFFAPGSGLLDLWEGATLRQQIPHACACRIGGSNVVYLTPYQGEFRALMLNGTAVVSGVIMDVKLSRGGEFYVYMTATGTYTRQMLDASGRVVSLRDDEAPLVAFVGPGGEPWVMSGTGLGVFVRPVYSSLGYLIAGDLYYPDARMIGGQLFVAGSFSNGVPRYETVDFAAPRIDLKALVPPAEALVLPAPTRKYWTGWFEFGPPPHGPGNASLVVRNMSGALDRPAILTDETVGHVSAPAVLGRFIAAPPEDVTVDFIEREAAACRERPVAYWDARSWPRWPKLPKGSWLCLQLYQGKDESLEQLKTSARALIASAPSYPLVLVGQQYTSNKNQVGYVDPTTPPPQDSEALKPLAQALVELANENPAVIMLVLFSGYGRRGGLGDHPDIVQPWQAFAAQLQAPTLERYPPKPIDPPPPPPPPPKSLYAKHKEHRMSTTQKVLIIGPAGKAGRPGKPNTGPWGGLKDKAGQPRNWRGVLFDGIVDGDGNLTPAPKAQASDYEFELSMPDNRHQLYHAGADGFFGADATAHSTSPGSDQFYVKPAVETRGGYESPVIYEGNLTSGLLSGQVEYVYNDGKGPAGVSCGFSVKVLS